MFTKEEKYERQLEASKRWKESNRDRVNQYARDYYNSKKNDSEYVKKNRERASEWGKKYPDKVSERCKEWSENNKERKTEVNRIWRRNNPDKVYGYVKRKRAANPDLHRFYCNTYKARRRGAVGNFTHQEWLDLKEKLEFTCPACGKSEPDIKLTIDHITPITKGGTNMIDNIQPLCGSCNSRKSNLDLRNYIDIIESLLEEEKK